MTRPRLLDLLQRTTPDGACAVWHGWKNSDGYAYVRSGGRDTPAHRVVYELTSGTTIAPGYEIDHLCSRRDCIEPSHLELVTHAENQRRMGLRQTSCRRARHDWTDSRNVYTRADGRRYCAVCAREANRRRRGATQAA